MIKILTDSQSGSQICLVGRKWNLLVPPRLLTSSHLQVRNYHIELPQVPPTNAIMSALSTVEWTYSNHRTGTTVQSQYQAQDIPGAKGFMFKLL